jgi:hypothetical protein
MKFYVLRLVKYNFYVFAITSLSSNFMYVGARIRNIFELIINNYYA